MQIPGTAGPMLAERPPDAVPLRVDGHEVARYVWRPELPPSTAPRPFLHPVRTLAGSLVTDVRPDSHTHQLGISIAAPDIDGCNFWGGRTFIAGHGPAWLDDHGVQRHQRWLSLSDTDLAHTVRWVDANRSILLRERRSITCRPVNRDAWALRVRTRLTNATQRSLPIRSPASLGRPGAGYGGFFWRGPAATGPVRVFSQDGTGVRSVHGKTADWVAVGALDSESRDWTMVFLPGNRETAQDRWFVRARDYLGVGSSLSWDRPLVLDPGKSINRNVIAVVADGALTADEAAALADAARSAA
ncbi:PmoA family protein [Glycomyces arizonensis]|uniref:DUF6807 domain-containing protein n=1 Tax=Glycomyces arizonensis TaxID=256035 RepID=UPI000404405F|nr:PmoA family protein [Glycomyces arizonensis]